MDDENLIYQGNTGKLINFEHLHEMKVFQIIAPDCDGCVSIALEGSQIEQVKKLYEAKHL